mmetsp:Transcript_8041/g.14554  ORF Transcript_8041/g.14554 Transcript_8041/m.14554 type:complete len:207 (-) Transcript_8041:202-822(-)
MRCEIFEEEDKSSYAEHCRKTSGEMEEGFTGKAKATSTPEMTPSTHSNASGRSPVEVEEEEEKETENDVRINEPTIKVSQLPYADELANWAIRNKTHSSLRGNDSAKDVDTARQPSNHTLKWEELFKRATVMETPSPTTRPRDDSAMKTPSPTAQENDFASELARRTSKVGTGKQPSNSDFTAIIAKRAVEVKTRHLPSRQETTIL